MPGTPGRRAVFLDRDGTLIFNEHYLADPSRIRFIPGALAAMRRFRDEGLFLALISNQSGIARGLISHEAHASVHARFTELLAAEGLALDASYYCPHGPDDGCECRKPRPGMLLRAAREHELDLAGSAMIGDNPTDVEAGRAAGCRALLFSGDWTSTLEFLYRTHSC